MCKCLMDIYCIELVGPEMLLVLSIAFLIFIAICGVVSLTLSSLGDREDLSITNLIIIIRSEVSTFHIVVIFFSWLCA